jgi:branched-chain amino acid transport system substrate-binding protein
MELEIHTMVLLKVLKNAGLALIGAVLFLSVPGSAFAKVEGDTVYLGAAISLTGKYSTNGAHTRRGYDLAVEKVNAAGGVTVDGQAYKLAIIYYDDESTPARGAQLAERLIQQDGVTFILGPYSSGLTRAMAPITEKYGIPMVEANGASISLFQEGYKYLFAVLSTTEQYLQGAIALAAETAEAGQSLRIALAMENDPFSQDVRAGVIADAERLGMRIVIDDKLPPELNDMSATMVKVRALKPDLLVVSGHAKGAALAIRQIADSRIDIPMLALTHCDAAQVIEKFAEKAEFALCASQWAPGLSYSDELFGSARDFADLFEATFDYAPPYQSAESAAAVMVFADAFERAGSFDPAAVRDALAATDLMTFYGGINFDEAGRNVAKPMVLFQVQDGEYRVVYPSDTAEAPFVHPTPRWTER